MEVKITFSELFQLADPFMFAQMVNDGYAPILLGDNEVAEEEIRTIHERLQRYYQRYGHEDDYEEQRENLFLAVLERIMDEYKEIK